MGNSNTTPDRSSTGDSKRVYAALRERTRRQERRRQQLVERLARQQREYLLRLTRNPKP
jgi:hypothetical protein